MDHDMGHTTYRASSHGELGAIADAIAKIAAHLPTLLQQSSGSGLWWTPLLTHTYSSA